MSIAKCRDIEALKYVNKIAYGLKDKKLVHISIVPRGLDCNCICPKCNSQLIARKGKIRIEHFAHISGSKCMFANETILHMLAKEIIKDSDKINLPPYKFKKSYIHSFGSSFAKPYLILREKTIYIDEVYLEHEAKRGGFIPDIVIKSNNVNLIVEIYVSHSVDTQKLKKIRKNNEAAIEIYLNEQDALKSKAEIRKKLIHEIINKKWLYHPSQKRAEENFYKECRENRKLQRKSERQIFNSRYSRAEKSYSVTYDKVAYNRTAYDKEMYYFQEKNGRIPTAQEEKCIKEKWRY